MKSFLEMAKGEILKILEKEKLLDKQVKVTTKVLTPKEAIGNPDRDDFPLLKGKERMIQAETLGAIGHAFSDHIGRLSGTIKSVLSLVPENNFHRAAQVGTINAICRALSLENKTIHCKDKEPGLCSKELILYLTERYPNVKKIIMIGLQPAMAEAISKKYELKILDLDRDNIGKKRFSTIIMDGEKDLDEILKDDYDLALVTGSAVVNNSIDDIARRIPKGKILYFGVTISGVAALLKLPRYCPLSH